MRVQGRASAETPGGDSAQSCGERNDRSSAPSPQPFQLIEGGLRQPVNPRGGRSHVCTWCGADFDRGWKLKEHFRHSPVCGRNKSVNNPTQTKYNDQE